MSYATSERSYTYARFSIIVLIRIFYILLTAVHVKKNVEYIWTCTQDALFRFAILFHQNQLYIDQIIVHFLKN